MLLLNIIHGSCENYSLMNLVRFDSPVKSFIRIKIRIRL